MRNHSWLPAVLFFAYACAFAQRQLPVAIADDLKERLALNDYGFALLISSSFAFVYATLALPAGWLADRSSRFLQAGVGLGLASLASLFMPVTHSVVGVFVLRALIGLGNAAFVPAAFSLLGDVGRAVNSGRTAAAFAAAPYIGVAAALFLGLYAMTSAFSVASMVGLGLAALLIIGGEPKRRPRDNKSDGAKPFIRGWKIILSADLAIALAAMGSHAILTWGIMWLNRVHTLRWSDAAILMASTVLIGGISGSAFSAHVGDIIWRRYKLPRLVLLASAALGVALIAPFLFLAPLRVAVILLTAVIFLAAVAMTAGPAGLQEMTDPARRGRQHGLAIAVINALGLGLGPLLIGLLTDAKGDPYALGVVMLMVIPPIFAAAAACAALTVFLGWQGRPRHTAPGLPSSTM